MACGTCGARAAAAAAQNNNISNANFSTSYQNQQSTEPCEFSHDQLVFFKQKMIELKDSGKYIAKGIKPATMNQYIGILLTSLNINNKCTYRTYLQTISDLVSILILEQNG